MSILVATLVAAAATSGAPVHTIEHEQNGKAYTVSYVAHVETAMRQLGNGAASHRDMQRCRVSGLVTVERRIADAASGEAISSVLPGQSELSQTRAGRCVSRDDLAAQLVAERGEDVRAHLAEVASADRPQLAATITAAKSLAEH